MELDSTDIKILEMLQADGRKSYSEIADEVKRTEVTVRRRVRRLTNEGVIKRFTVVLDRMKTGKQICAMIRVKTMMKEATLIAEKIKEYDEVDEAYYLDGACGIMLRVTVNNLGELRDFIEKRLGKVGEVETCIVLETVKSPF